MIKAESNLNHLFPTKNRESDSKPDVKTAETLPLWHDVRLHHFPDFWLTTTPSGDKKHPS